MSRLLTIEGLRIRVDVDGTGPPLLLIMGIGGNIEMWEPFRSRLTGFRTIAFDLPGAGDSDVPWRPLGMRSLARLCGQLLDLLGFESADVLGVSYGGALAQELAYRHPERVRRLVLVSTFCGVGAIPGQPLATALLLTPARYYSSTLFKFVAPLMMGGATRRKPELLEDQARRRRHRPPSLRGYAQQLASITGWSSLPWLHRIAQPVLVMTGDDDPIVRTANGRMLAWLIPDARLHIVRGGGHLLLFDQPIEAAGLVAGFLASRVDGQPLRV